MKRYVNLKFNQCTELLKHKVTKISALKHFLDYLLTRAVSEFLFLVGAAHQNYAEGDLEDQPMDPNRGKGS